MTLTRVAKPKKVPAFSYRGRAVLLFLMMLVPFQTPAQGERASSATQLKMALIPEGVYRPLFRGGEKPEDKQQKRQVPVRSFLLDRYPVTNREFFDFVRERPEWGKTAVPPLFADQSYLSHWENGAPSEDQGNQPVRFVSWFAAKNFCKWRGKRLPTVAEWEYVALASEHKADARDESEYLKQILNWYATPGGAEVAEVGKRKPNYYGVSDLHGLVWEWVADFNSALVTGESRGDSALERSFYCGAGSQNVSERDRVNYPAFMRFGFRSSLEGTYAVHNLGFRCAGDL